MYTVEVLEWDFEKLCWKNVDKKSTKVKTSYKRYTNAFNAVCDEIDRLGDEIHRLTDIDNEKISIETKSRRYTIYGIV